MQNYSFIQLFKQLVLLGAVLATCLSSNAGEMTLRITDKTGTVVGPTAGNGPQSNIALLNIATGKSWSLRLGLDSAPTFSDLPEGAYAITAWNYARGHVDSANRRATREPSRRDYWGAVWLAANESKAIDVRWEALPIRPAPTLATKPSKINADFYRAHAEQVCGLTDSSEISSQPWTLGFNALEGNAVAAEALAKVALADQKRAVRAQTAAFRAQLTSIGDSVLASALSEKDLDARMQVIDDSFGIGVYCQDHPKYGQDEEACRKDQAFVRATGGPLRRLAAFDFRTQKIGEDYLEHAKFIRQACATAEKPKQTDWAITAQQGEQGVALCEKSRYDIGEFTPETCELNQARLGWAYRTIKLSGDDDDKSVIPKGFSFRYEIKAALNDLTLQQYNLSVDRNRPMTASGDYCHYRLTLPNLGYANFTYSREKAANRCSWDTGFDKGLAVRLLTVNERMVCEAGSQLFITVETTGEEVNRDNNRQQVDLCQQIDETEATLESIAIVRAEGSGYAVPGDLRPADRIRVQLVFDEEPLADSKTVELRVARVTPTTSFEQGQVRPIGFKRLRASVTENPKVFTTQPLLLTEFERPGAPLTDGDFVEARLSGSSRDAPVDRKIVQGKVGKLLSLRIIDDQGEATGKIVPGDAYRLEARFESPPERGPLEVMLGIKSAASDVVYEQDSLDSLHRVSVGRLSKLKELRSAVWRSDTLRFTESDEPASNRKGYVVSSGDSVSVRAQDKSALAIVQLGEPKEGEGSLIVTVKNHQGEGYNTPVRLKNTATEESFTITANRKANIPAATYELGLRADLNYTDRVTVLEDEDTELKVPPIGLVRLNWTFKSNYAFFNILRKKSRGDKWGQNLTLRTGMSAVLLPAGSYSYVVEDQRAPSLEGDMTASDTSFTVIPGKETRVNVELN
ncbi:MAG: hypothetical protein AAF662_14870 [Pseudomonadota bacterium]